MPFGDAVTIARVVGTLESKGKNVIIRREGASSFSDLREGALVLVGAFNNEWSLRLTRQLRYSLALDSDKHLIYIRDAKKLGMQKTHLHGVGVGLRTFLGTIRAQPATRCCRITR